MATDKITYAMLCVRHSEKMPYVPPEIWRMIGDHLERTRLKEWITRFETPDGALVAAAEGGLLAEARYALASGANVNARVGDEEALELAAERGHGEMVTLLLAAGANVHLREDLAVRVAAAEGRAGVVEMLIKAGANIHVYEDNPLQIASVRGWDGVVAVLLAAGADVRVARNQALRLATARRHTKVVALLKEAMRGGNAGATF